jgi:hypothetical protein
MSQVQRHGETDPPGTVLATSSSKFALSKFALALFVLLLVWFGDVAFGWRSFFTRDFSNFGYPLAYHVKASYLAGEVPLWNPYNLTGLPFLAQWNTLCLYPPSLIYVLLPLPGSLNLFNLLHLYLGGIGMFCLARRWLEDNRAASVAGVSYAFGGVLVSALMWPNNIAALGWLPLVLLTGERAASAGGKYVLVATLALSMQFLAGAPEITALTWASLLAFIVFHPPTESRIANGEPRVARRLLRLSLTVLLTIGIGAAQFLPFLDLLRQSHRDAGYSTDAWTLTWAGLGNLLVPLFRTVQDRDGIFFQPSQQWVTSYYPGVTILLLALLGIFFEPHRRVRLLVCLGALSVVLALGPHGAVYAWLRKVAPTLGLLRYPIKFIVPLAVAVPLLAGFGARAWLTGRVHAGKARWLVATLVVLTLALTAWSQWKPIPGENPAMTLRSSTLSLVFLLGLVALANWSQRHALPRPTGLVPTVIALVIYGDLLCANHRLNPVVEPRYMKENVADIRPRPGLGDARVMVSGAAHQLLDATIFPTPLVAVRVPRQSLLLDANLLERVPKLDGFFSLYLPPPAIVVARLGKETNAPVEAVMDFLGVSHVSNGRKPWQWDKRADWLPPLTLVPRVKFLGRTNTFLKLFSGDFHPGEEVFLPPEAAGRVHVDGVGQGKIVSRHIGSQRIEATLEVNRPMMLVLAQANYSGWRATLDGQRTPIWPANYAFQALEVPPGRHRVILTFRPASFETGAAISLLMLTGCLIASWRCHRPDDRRGADGAMDTGAPA